MVHYYNPSIYYTYRTETRDIGVGWNDKSRDAIRRETHAKAIFENDFLPAAKEAAVFPFTMNDIIPPEIHLTNLCYRDFRKYVISKGCTVRRREITNEEKAALKTADRKKVKMYSLTLSIRRRPDDDAIKVNKEVGQTANGNGMKKKEEEKTTKKKVVKEDSLALNALGIKEFALIKSILLQTGQACGGSEKCKVQALSSSSCSSKKKRPLGDRTNAKNSQGSPSTSSAAPSKKLKVSKGTDSKMTTSTATNKKASDANLKITTSIVKLLHHANVNRLNEVQQIKIGVAKVKAIKMEELSLAMQKKEDEEIEEVCNYYDALTKMIHQVAPVDDDSNSDTTSASSFFTNGRKTSSERRRFECK